MSRKTKPEITVTIEFQGITIEDLTVEEVRELRDVLNTLVGEPRVERVIERYEYHPWRYWTTASYTVSNGGDLPVGFTGLSHTTNEIVISCKQ